MANTWHFMLLGLRLYLRAAAMNCLSLKSVMLLSWYYIVDRDVDGSVDNSVDMDVDSHVDTDVENHCQGSITVRDVRHGCFRFSMTYLFYIPSAPLCPFHLELTLHGPVSCPVLRRSGHTC
jgi:hypothetical protein